MSETIIVGIFGGLISLAVCLINNLMQTRKNDADQDKRTEELAHKTDVMLAEVKSEFEKSTLMMSANVQQQIAVLDTKFDDLVRKVEKHNGLVERVYKLESDTAVQCEQIKVINHRVQDLEKK